MTPQEIETAARAWMAHCPETGGCLIEHTKQRAEECGKVAYSPRPFRVVPLYEASALSVAEPEGWRTIESAPKNKTMVALIYRKENYTRYGVGWFLPWVGWQAWDYQHEPTHWQPLPAAPSAPSVGQPGDKR